MSLVNKLLVNKNGLEHLLSFFLVSLFLLSLVYFFNENNKRDTRQTDERIRQWVNLDFIDFDDPMHRALLEEALNIYEPDNKQANAQLLLDIKAYRENEIITATAAQEKKVLSKQNVLQLLWMYLKFILVYIVTLLITWYGVQTIGVYRFVREKEKKTYTFQSLVSGILSFKKVQSFKEAWGAAKPLFYSMLKVCVKFIVLVILFSPAYILAYSFRTRFDTDMVLFMILLGVISNSVLITYSNKFYTFLVSESRKGYVETALVKNLDNSYNLKTSSIHLSNIFAIKKKFTGHVFQQIFENAQYQYMATVKEQATFLITGLIIIEMALNIQGHLCYELLKNILYNNYAFVLIIMLGIFYVVKMTEIFIDFIITKQKLKYSNL